VSDMEFVAFFDRFVSDFTSFDGAVIATRYAPPYLAVAADGSSRLFSDIDSVANYFQTVLDEYFRRGVRSCRYHSLDVVPIGKQSALASVTWEMLRGDGTVQTSWRESYNMQRTPTGLKVSVSTDHLA
jgi:hypothetical protein